MGAGDKPDYIHILLVSQPGVQIPPRLRCCGRARTITHDAPLSRAQTSLDSNHPHTKHWFFLYMRASGACPQLFLKLSTIIRLTDIKGVIGSYGLTAKKIGQGLRTERRSAGALYKYRARNGGDSHGEGQCLRR